MVPQASIARGERYSMVLRGLFAVVGRLLSRGGRETGPGQVQEIPAYALPTWRVLLDETWERTSDILTIVTPLLVGGSVVLALLNHVGADRLINASLMPVTVWWRQRTWRQASLSPRLATREEESEHSSGSLTKSPRSCARLADRKTGPIHTP